MATTHRPTRLNPFAFPADTDFRFVLLIVVVIGASLILYSTMYNDIPANWDHLQAVQTQCANQAAKIAPTDSVEDITMRSTLTNKCTAPLYQTRALTIAGAILLLFALAGVIYFIFPAWKIRRNKLVLLTTEDAPEMVAYLTELCCQAGLSTPPRFLLKPLGTASSGHAFGHLGRYYVVINGGLVTRFYKDRSAFRAILLHELAHLHNKDIDKTYFSLAIGLAFLLFALLPSLFIRVTFVLFELPLLSTLNLGWRILALSAFVYLSILAILRSREIYADIRASVWDSPSGSLRQILSAMPRPKYNRWRYILHHHPDPENRLSLLHETHRLFPLGFWEAFVTGLGTSVTLDTLDSITSALLPDINDVLLELGITFIFGTLIVGIVGVGIWRTIFASMIGSKPFRGIGRLGIGLGTGFLLGQYLSLAAYAYLQSKDILTGLDALFFYAAWIPLIILGFYAFLYWIAAGASTWLEVAARARSPRFIYTLGLSIAGLWLTVWLAILDYYIYPSFLAGNDVSFSSILDSVAQSVHMPVAPLIILIVGIFEETSQHPLIFLALTCLWLFPLSAWFWHRKIGLPRQAQWASLDPGDQPFVLPPQPPLRPGIALSFGTISGLLSSLVLILLNFLARSWLSEDIAILWLVHGQVIVAAFIQVAIAIVVTCRVKRLGSLHGLLAAFVSGCFLSIGASISFFLYFSLLGKELSATLQLFAPLTWTIFSTVVDEGALLSLPVVLLVAFLIAQLHKKALPVHL